MIEGYLNLRIQPWIRRLVTRLIAIVPALLTIQLAGEESTGKLLVFSQVILSLQARFCDHSPNPFCQRPHQDGGICDSCICSEF